MADVYGLTEEGFFAKTFEVIVEEMRADYRDAFGLSLDDTFDTPDGVVMAIVARAAATLWELGERVHSASNKSAATGAALAQIGLLTNTLWQGATRSAVVLTLTGDPTTLVTAGSQAKTASTGKKFETILPATIVATNAWFALSAYSVGDRVTAGGHVYVATASGLSGGVAPSGTAADLVDGTVHWRHVGPGTGDVDADAQAIDVGPTIARSGDVTVIETPVSGWDGVRNLSDASPGSNRQTNAEFRLAIEEDLQAAGTSPVPSIRAALRDVRGVTAVTVFHNNTESVNSDGVPPKSVEALVEGGDDQLIWNALLASVAGGIRTFGTVAGFANDSEGVPQAQAFSRVEDVDVWVTITLERNSSDYPTAGNGLVKDAIVEWGDAQRSGRDVEPTAISAQAFKVPGVLRVTGVLVDTINPPASSARIPMTIRQRAVYDTSRITVVATEGEP